MGLDMYLYRISKVDGLNAGDKISRKEFNERYPYATTVDANSKEAKLKAIKNFGTPITIIEKVYVPELVGKLGGFKGIVEISKCYEGYSGNEHEVEFHCYDESLADVGCVLINDRKTEDSVLEDKEYEYIAFYTDEVEYQREGLSNEGWGIIPENCIYSENKKIIKRMTETGGLDKKFIESWEDGKTLFLAWW